MVDRAVIVDKPRFNEKQRLAVIQWIAAGESTDNIYNRITRENDRNGPRAPWPPITPYELDGFRRLVAPAVALFREKRQNEAISSGLAKREQQLALLADAVNEMKPIIEIIEEKIHKLVAAGGMDFDIASLLPDGSPSYDGPNVIEGEVVRDEDGNYQLDNNRRQSGYEPAMVATAHAMGLDPLKMMLRDSQFKRLESLILLHTRVTHEYQSLIMLLSRVSSTIDRERPPDFEGRKQQAEKILARARKAGSSPEVTDPLPGEDVFERFEDEDPTPDIEE